MKRLILTAAIAFSASALFAQPIDNAGLEAWRGGTTGSSTVVTIASPSQWFGLDSLVIGLAQTFGPLAGLTIGTDWNQQMFQESSFVHSGSSAAKVMTRQQDALGIVPGMLSNAKIEIDIFSLMGGGDPLDAISFTGGTSLSLRATSVSAWVAYTPGIDTATGMPGVDAGLMTVQAIATIGGNDSAVGTGTMIIPPSTSYNKVTATINYTTTDYDVYALRMTFSSSGGTGAILDSSTLYVDDVTMEGVPQSVGNVSGNRNVVSVYPNPAVGYIYLTGKAPGYVFDMYNLSGKKVATTTLSGTDKLSTRGLAAGVYFYAITNEDGISVQRGKVQVLD